MSTYIFIHGAWCGKWAWEPTAKRLQAAGHTAIALDNPGHNSTPGNIGEQTATTYAQAAVKVIEQQSEPVILVGHSLGGAVISLCAEMCPQHIKKLIYCTAWLLKTGRSVDGPTSVRPLDWGEAAKRGEVILSADGHSTLPTREFMKDFCCNDLTPEQTELVLSHMTWEAPAAQYEKMVITEKFLSIPRIYIRTTLDASITIDLQDRMIYELPCERVYSLHTGHMPQLADPEGLLKILLQEA